MRSIRQFCAAFSLTIVLACSTFAGDMLGPGVAANGEIGGPGATTAGDIQLPGDLAEEIALGLLLNVSSLL
jgi:hypothetical protein